MSYTAVDYFCGMGGSSSGLREAGFEIQVAANHWDRAIETHAANHPDTEHLCANIQEVDVRYLPAADLLWASPICTELSPAGGRKKRRDADQPSLWEEHGHVPQEALERTRVTFWEVLRYAEVHTPPIILVENVAEAADWHLLPTWLHGWTTLGYRVQIICVSAAHVGDEDGNDPAPQWRDRMYFAITRDDMAPLDVDPRPLAWCDSCAADVRAQQWWKPKARRIHGQPVGKYGPQYLYVCPEGNHGVVEPYVAPAAAAIDWTDLGTRIGDRADHGLRPLGANTLRRIEMGLRTIADPALVAAGGNTWDGASGAANNYLRAWPLYGSPTPAQVTAIQNGIALSAPFVTMLRRNGRAVPVAEPAQTFSAGGFHHGLTVPPGAFISAHHDGYAAGDTSLNKPVTVPLRTITTKGTRSLVIPYRKGAKPYPAESSALSTMATREAHGLLQAALEVDDCHFRMLTPREAANAQRFARGYVILGNQGEQQMQAGNAVPVNVAHWLGRQAIARLGGAA